MKVAVLAESVADADALLELTAGIISGPLEAVESGLQLTGWHSVRRNLPILIRKVHYSSDAEGLIVAADTDNTTLIPGKARNRRDELAMIVEAIVAGLGHVHGRPRLKVALAVAAPAIEAWLLCPRSDELSEAAWENGIIQNREPYSKRELKIRLHGVQRLDSAARRRNMIIAARQCCQSIGKLRERFPNGFGSFDKDLRNWQSLHI